MSSPYISADTGTQNPKWNKSYHGRNCFLFLGPTFAHSDLSLYIGSGQKI